MKRLFGPLCYACSPRNRALRNNLQLPAWIVRIPGLEKDLRLPSADQFKSAFGVNNAEARCLVYEVMTDLRAAGKYDSTPVDIARKVASRCALVLKAPR
jgi:hypothetical protein